MRKLGVVLAFSLFMLAGLNARILPGNTGGRVSNGYHYWVLEVIDQAVPTANDLVWYAQQIAGYSVIGIEGFDVSSGNVPTTISAQAIYSTGAAVSVDAQTITAGTDLTNIKSPWYKFTLPADSVTRNMSFSFIVAD